MEQMEEVLTRLREIQETQERQDQVLADLKSTQDEMLVSLGNKIENLTLTSTKAQPGA